MLGNIIKNLHDIGLPNDFMDMTQKTQATKVKTELKQHQIKNFLYSKGTVIGQPMNFNFNTVKGQPMKWYKMCA